MSESFVVVIGAPELLDALRRQAGTGVEVATFGDHEALQALEVITTRRPRIIALERLFAVTSRGAALINRIKSDPSLTSTEIRIVSHDGTYSRVSQRRADAKQPVQDRVAEADAGPTAPPATEAQSTGLDYRGTRRTARFRMEDGTELQVDGALAKIVDLSTQGAQVLSQSPLKPQQRVRVTLADDFGVVRFNAAVAWASFEIPKGVSRYRVGLEFKDAEAGAVDAFCRRHQKAGG
jgi:hypothetical protein